MLKRYELRYYYGGELKRYIPFKTEQEAVDYFDYTDDLLDDEWGLYLVTYDYDKDHAVLVKVMRREKVSIKNLRFIGHLRGIDQYEVINDINFRLALVLKLNEKYYLSFADCEENYNKNIASRITLAYKAPQGIDTSCLGKVVTITE